MDGGVGDGAAGDVVESAWAWVACEVAFWDVYEPTNKKQTIKQIHRDDIIHHGPFGGYLFIYLLI